MMSAHFSKYENQDLSRASVDTLPIDTELVLLESELIRVNQEISRGLSRAHYEQALLHKEGLEKALALIEYKIK